MMGLTKHLLFATLLLSACASKPEGTQAKQRAGNPEYPCTVQLTTPQGRPLADVQAVAVVRLDGTSVHTETLRTDGAGRVSLPCTEANRQPADRVSMTVHSHEQTTTVPRATKTGRALALDVGSARITGYFVDPNGQTVRDPRSLLPGEVRPFAERQWAGQVRLWRGEELVYNTVNIDARNS